MKDKKKNLTDFSDVLTAKDLYEILPIGRNAIYKLLKDNTIKHIRVGNKILIPKQYLIDFLKTNT